ncbi:MAG TPA: hypothetical protein VGD60_18050 [Candidatus Acidoferrales bacterium]
MHEPSCLASEVASRIAASAATQKTAARQGTASAVLKKYLSSDFLSRSLFARAFSTRTTPRPASRLAPEFALWVATFSRDNVTMPFVPFLSRGLIARAFLQSNLEPRAQHKSSPGGAT